MLKRSRRQFFEDTFFATAALSAAWQAGGAASLKGAEPTALPRPIQLGLVTYMWGANWDLPTLLKNLQLTGFGGVELRTSHKHGVELSLRNDERKDVASRFKDANIQLVGFGTICEYHAMDRAVVRKNIEETKAWIKLAHDCGASGVKVRPNGLPSDVPPEVTLEQIGKSLDECAGFGADYGVEVRLEVHGAGTQLLPNIKTIMEAAPHRGATVCWNCNSDDLKGAGLAANFSMVRDRLGKTIHIHELTSGYPWSEFFSLLKAISYQGWTLLEEGVTTADPIRVMNYYRLVWENLLYNE